MKKNFTAGIVEFSRLLRKKSDTFKPLHSSNDDLQPVKNILLGILKLW